MILPRPDSGSTYKLGHQEGRFEYIGEASNFAQDVLFVFRSYTGQRAGELFVITKDNWFSETASLYITRESVK